MGSTITLEISRMPTKTALDNQQNQEFLLPFQIICSGISRLQRRQETSLDRTDTTHSEAENLTISSRCAIAKTTWTLKNKSITGIVQFPTSEDTEKHSLYEECFKSLYFKV